MLKNLLIYYHLCLNYLQLSSERTGIPSRRDFLSTTQPVCHSQPCPGQETPLTASSPRLSLSLWIPLVGASISYFRSRQQWGCLRCSGEPAHSCRLSPPLSVPAPCCHSKPSAFVSIALLFAKDARGGTGNEGAGHTGLLGALPVLFAHPDPETFRRYHPR